MAKLYFRYGAMNSGKSTALMQVAHNYEEQGMKVLILKPQVDTKGGGELVSRLGVRRKADLLIPPELDVFEAVKAANAASGPLACVLCDESQFFTPEQAEQLFMITVDLNIPVICYGLRADFSLKGFPGSTRLLELAHTIEEMKTICTCGRKAICNCRKVNGQFVFEGEQVAIDLENDVQYVSMCPQCYFKARRAFYAARKNGDPFISYTSRCTAPGAAAFLRGLKPLRHGLRRVRFPLLSPAVTSSPGAGEVGPQGDAFTLCRKLCRHRQKAVPLGKVAANAVSRRKGYPRQSLQQAVYRLIYQFAAFCKRD